MKSDRESAYLRRDRCSVTGADRGAAFLAATLFAGFAVRFFGGAIDPPPALVSATLPLLVPLSLTFIDCCAEIAVDMPASASAPLRQTIRRKGLLLFIFTPS